MIRLPGWLVLILFLVAVVLVCIQAAAARPAALPDIPECGTSDRPDLVVGYLVCAANATWARQNDLDARLAAIEQLQGSFRERLWAFAGDRGEFDELSRLQFRDPRRQLQTKDQIYKALCRERLVTC
jgi:hypothetical protein